jgi:large subunit ribosomal protein L10
MSNRRIEREVLYEYVTELFKESSYLLFTSYTGLTVKDFAALRSDLRAAGAKCVVLKNSYLMLGIKEMGIEVSDDFELTGDTLVTYGAEDPCAAAKAIREYAKDRDAVNFKAGVVDGKFVSADSIKNLADMPPKEILLSQLLGMMKAPGQKLVRVLSTRKNTIVWTLENYAKKLEETKS